MVCMCVKRDAKEAESRAGRGERCRPRIYIIKAEGCGSWQAVRPPGGRFAFGLDHLSRVSDSEPKSVKVLRAKSARPLGAYYLATHFPGIWGVDRTLNKCTPSKRAGLPAALASEDRGLELGQPPGALQTRLQRSTRTSGHTGLDLDRQTARCSAQGSNSKPAATREGARAGSPKAQLAARRSQIATLPPQQTLEEPLQVAHTTDLTGALHDRMFNRFSRSLPRRTSLLFFLLLLIHAAAVSTTQGMDRGCRRPRPERAGPALADAGGQVSMTFKPFAGVGGRSQARPPPAGFPPPPPCPGLPPLDIPLHSSHCAGCHPTT